MDRAKIESMLRRAATLTEEARGLLLAAAEEAPEEAFANFRGSCGTTYRGVNAIDVPLILGHIDEALRPKGPAIMLEHAGDRTRIGERTPSEYVRSTKAQIILREHGAEVRYNAKTGEKVGQETSYAGRIRGWRNPISRWRIPADELARIATFGAAK